MLPLLPLLLSIPTTLSLNPSVQIPNSSFTLPVAVRINASGSAKIIEADRARARHFLQVAQEKQRRSGLIPKAVVGAPITNGAVTYTASVAIGNPATQYTMIVDTGSAITLVGPYVQTSTSVDTGNTISGVCGGGTVCVKEFLDRVTLAPGLVINRQAIAVDPGCQQANGILGLGPTHLTQGAVCTCPSCLVPTVTDNLFSQGTIPADEIGVSFEPATSASVTNGEISFGGVDTTKFTGTITFIPSTVTSPANQFWGIDQSISYGTGTAILSTTAGIVDTGTTLVLIATDAFQRYQTASGAVLDATTGLLSLTPTQFGNLKSLFFHTGGTTFEFTANAQAWPRSLNSLIGGTSALVYLVVGDIGTPSGSGLDFINGFTFLERFYSVFDTTNNRVGFANTPFTHATTN